MAILDTLPETLLCLMSTLHPIDYLLTHFLVPLALNVYLFSLELLNIEVNKIKLIYKEEIISLASPNCSVSPWYTVGT